MLIVVPCFAHTHTHIPTPGDRKLLFAPVAHRPSSTHHESPLFEGKGGKVTKNKKPGKIGGKQTTLSWEPIPWSMEWASRHKMPRSHLYMHSSLGLPRGYNVGVLVSDVRLRTLGESNSDFSKNWLAGI